MAFSVKSIIIGSGMAALATAIRLRVAGYRVEVFEKNSSPGGKLHSRQLGPYRFDGGPSLFTMPQYVDELFTLAGKNPRDYYSYERLDETCRYFWKDGFAFTAPGDPEKFALEAEKVFGIQANRVRDYFKHIRKIYRSSARIFLEQSLHRSSTWLQTDTLKALVQIGSFDLGRSMHRVNVARLGEAHLVQLFDRFATYNGSDPYRAPGILNVIPWLEHGFGTYAPQGGMIAIPTALYNLATELGVEFHFNSPVDQICMDRGKAIGIESKGIYYAADRVVSNMDVYYTYERLLPGIKSPKHVSQGEASSSALVFYWGMSKAFPQLGLHNIFFSEDYQSEFEDIFKHNRVPVHPTIYVNIGSKSTPQDAPPHGENWFVMVNTPPHDGRDWRDITSQVRDKVLQALSKALGEDIGACIEVEEHWNPAGIESLTLSHRGALYGASSNSRLSAFLRHPNQVSGLKHLFFCGGSVHPGGGIPLALLSGKITAELMGNANDQ